MKFPFLVLAIAYGVFSLLANGIGVCLYFAAGSGTQEARDVITKVGGLHLALFMLAIGTLLVMGMIAFLTPEKSKMGAK